MLLARTGSYSSIAAFIGGVSFPMYLNHWIGTFIANAVYTRIGLRDSFLSHISGVFAALILATILYLLVDRSIKKYRDRYFTLGYGKLAAALAVTLVSIGLAGGLLITGAIPPS
jgi:peptidoglycan/LPS O-acetylase OafA/YrhL